VAKMSSWWRASIKKFRQARVRLLRSPGAPSEIAGGMALGVFIALMPIMGLQMPVAVAVAEALRRLANFQLSRIAAAAGVWITNPVTAAPIYGICYFIGRPFARFLLPDTQQHIGAEAGVVDLEALSLTGPGAIEVILGLIIGGVLLGVPAAWVGYRLTHSMVARYHARREQRRARRAPGRALASGT
jgi:uncharacterized protein